MVILNREMCAFFTVLLLIGAGWGMIDDKPARNWPIIARLLSFFVSIFVLFCFIIFVCVCVSYSSVMVVLFGVFFGLSQYISLFGIASIIRFNNMVNSLLYLTRSESSELLSAPSHGLRTSIGTSLGLLVSSFMKAPPEKFATKASPMRL